MTLVVRDKRNPFQFHPVEVCQLPCCLHGPSDHHMATWRLNWREDREIMERLCPEHGVGHPDPDDLRIRSGVDPGVHGCCGCCRRPE